jgi:hypothetical protein
MKFVLQKTTMQEKEMDLFKGKNPAMLGLSVSISLTHGVRGE